MVDTSDELVVDVLLGEQDCILIGELLILMTSVKNLGYPFVRADDLKDDGLLGDGASG